MKPKPLFPLLVEALKEYDKSLPAINQLWEIASCDEDIYYVRALEQMRLRQLRDAFFKEPENPNSRDKLDCVGIDTFRKWAEITK